jgi:hypothetical protein
MSNENWVVAMRIGASGTQNWQYSSNWYSDNTAHGLTDGDEKTNAFFTKTNQHKVCFENCLTIDHNLNKSLHQMFNEG